MAFVPTEPYEGYAIVELMGHRRLAGRVSQAEQYGVAMLRLDVPREDGSESTHFFGGASIYGLHPTGEDEARAVAARCDPSPVQRWELPALPPMSQDDRASHCGGCGELEDECSCYDEMSYQGEVEDCDDEPCENPETGLPTGEPPDFEAELAVEASKTCCPPGKMCDECTPF